ncbi:hypothetical protein BT67DRAFT_386041 [Trichocladium antarcticum]|uniref:Uncharacterized protein n=1 Tax=Trichocladium antarcticum TaxID=1450529 RepID=A0AAN6ZBH8_9PEZI|nr:hypothetical protein BT67DRAFT_386041 [Trichocladium antarcticum]
MCSFILQRLICQECRSPIVTDRVDFQGCGRPAKKCRGNKKRGASVRYVGADECDRCSLEMFEAGFELASPHDGENKMGDEESELGNSGSLPPDQLLLGVWIDAFQAVHNKVKE